MEDRVENGRAYSFYNDRLSGLSIAKIYTRYVTVAEGQARATISACASARPWARKKNPPPSFAKTKRSRRELARSQGAARRTVRALSAKRLYEFFIFCASGCTSPA